MHTPADYDDFKKMQRREPVARSRFLFDAAEDNTPNTAENIQLASNVAIITANKPAPPDLVADNKAAFREVTDNAWLEAVCAKSPGFAKWMATGQNAALVKGSIDGIRPIATAAMKLLDAARDAGALQNSPGEASYPSPVSEPAKANPSDMAPPADDEVGLRPDAPPATQGAPAPATLPGSTTDPVQPAASTSATQDAPTATTVPGSTTDPALPVVATPGTQSAPTATTVPGNATDPALPVATPATQSAPTATTAPGSATDPTRSPVAPATPNPPTVAGSVGPKPSETSADPNEVWRKKYLKSAPSTAAAIIIGVAGIYQESKEEDVARVKQLILSQNDIPQELALSILEGRRSGNIDKDEALARLKFVWSKDYDTLLEDINRSFVLNPEEAEALIKRIRGQDIIPADAAVDAVNQIRSNSPGTLNAWALIFESQRKQYDALVDNIIGARGKSAAEIAEIRRMIYRQNFGDQLFLDRVLAVAIDGAADEKWLREALRPKGMADQAREFFKALPGGAQRAAGSIVDMLASMMTSPMDPEEKIFLTGLLDAKIDDKESYLKNVQYVSSVFPEKLNNYLELLSEIYGDEKTSEAARNAIKFKLKYSLSGRAIEIQEGADEIAPPSPGMEGSIGNSLGESVGGMVPGTIGFLVNPFVGLSLTILQGGGESRRETRENSRIPGQEKLAGYWGAATAAATSTPVLTIMRKIPILEKIASKLASGPVLAMAVDAGDSALLQATQQFANNYLHRYLGEDKNLLEGVATSAIEGALFSAAAASANIVGENSVELSRNTIRRISIIYALGSQMSKANPSVQAQMIFSELLSSPEVRYVYIDARSAARDMAEHDLDFSEYYRRNGTELGMTIVVSGGKSYFRMPTATVVGKVYGTEYGDFIFSHLAFSPAGPTGVEAAKVLETAKNTSADKSSVPDSASDTGAQPGGGETLPPSALPASPRPEKLDASREKGRPQTSLSPVTPDKPSASAPLARLPFGGDAAIEQHNQRLNNGNYAAAPKYESPKRTYVPATGAHTGQKRKGRLEQDQPELNFWLSDQELMRAIENDGMHNLFYAHLSDAAPNRNKNFLGSTALSREQDR